MRSGGFKQLSKEKPLEEHSTDELLQLLRERVLNENVAMTWTLYDSLFHKADIEATVAEKHPDARLLFRSWVGPEFLTTPMSSKPIMAGVRTALLGSLWMIVITMIIAFPIGVGAAIYLEEYATDNWLNRLIQTNINNLAGVPSIIYGMLGLAIFVRALEMFTSGSMFGVTGSNGRTILSASLTMALLILPIIIINGQEAIRAVPSSLRQASYGLGATKWQTIWNHVLPVAMPGILTGTILAMSRGIGETAPLIVVGASTFIATDPDGPFSKFTALPIIIYNWTSRPQDEFRNIAAAAIIILLILLLSLNSVAILLRNRFRKGGI
jgi:phosphate transport system permease protein